MTETAEKRLRYFFDTEFDERGPEHPVRLISIGVVSEDGREYYAEVDDYDVSTAHDWLKQNVVPLLTGPRKPRAEIARELIEFCAGSKGGARRSWAYFGAYDWVVFCQVFGTMMEMPKAFPHYVLDIKQYMRQLGVERSDLPPQGDSTLHNALADARWNREVFDVLQRKERSR